MKNIKLYVGTIITGNSGQTNDDRRPVEFTGEELGTYRAYGEGRDGGITDTRGQTHTLYRAEDGRLIAHVEDWSHWQGEPTTESIHEVTETDLQPGGTFEMLGAACGYGRPLTLDEALTDA